MAGALRKLGFQKISDSQPRSELKEDGVGCICYSPLAQDALTDKYLKGIPEVARAARKGTTIGGRYLTEEKLDDSASGIKRIDAILA